MKRFILVQVALLAVLMVVAVSCTTYRDASGDYYEDEPRYMYQRTPYVGAGSVIIVERDPITGRYYQVSPYGYYSGSPYYNDSRYQDSRYYNNNRYYNNRGYTNRTYQQPVTEQQRQQTRENMDAAKERVLGQKKNN
jgi:hypothetical protein